MKKSLGITVLLFSFSMGPQALATAPEYKACHAGNNAACKHWRDRSCNDDANPAACDYEEALKQKDPFEWCEKRYPADNNAAAYRWCINGSPDR